MLNQAERRSKEKIINLEVYTDGSLKKIGKTMTFGGWSFIVTKDNQKIYETAGSEYGTTNQRMELIAIREALKYASSIRGTNEKVIIYSDSAYAINCYLQEWYITWLANGWRNSKKEAVANQDLWLEIIPYFDNFWYYFTKVKAHANNYWNNECDRLAQLEAQTLKDNFRGIQNE